MFGLYTKFKMPNSIWPFVIFMNFMAEYRIHAALTSLLYNLQK